MPQVGGADEIADCGNEQRLASFRCNKWGGAKEHDHANQTDLHRTAVGCGCGSDRRRLSFGGIDPDRDGHRQFSCQALMFHHGDYVGSPTGSGFGYLGFNKEKTTDQTVVLIYRATMGSCGGCDDATSADVRFQLQNGRIVALDSIPDMQWSR